MSQQHEWRTWEGSGRNSGILLDAIVHGPPSPSLPLSRLLVCSRATHLPASPVLRTSRLLRHPREGLLPLRPSPGGPGHDARASRPHTHGATHASLAHSPPAAAAACSATSALFVISCGTIRFEVAFSESGHFRGNVTRRQRPFEKIPKVKPWRCVRGPADQQHEGAPGVREGSRVEASPLSKGRRVRPLQNDLGGAGQGQHNDPHWPSPVEVRERERDTRRRGG